ncbi:hypothetical protein [Caulobacter flavus]|nr:hypothetical protein [Caulobacter flavus]
MKLDLRRAIGTRHIEGGFVTACLVEPDEGAPVANDVQSARGRQRCEVVVIAGNLDGDQPPSGGKSSLGYENEYRTSGVK